MNALIQQAADHLIKSKYAIALTGAGISTESGIKGYRKNWARRIQKIYEGDLLTCPKCHGPMRVISFIEDRDVIRKILDHLSQLPASDKWLYGDSFSLVTYHHRHGDPQFNGPRYRTVMNAAPFVPALLGITHHRQTSLL